jgi:hypothetical protein
MGDAALKRSITAHGFNRGNAMGDAALKRSIIAHGFSRGNAMGDAALKRSITAHGFSRGNAMGDAALCDDDDNAHKKRASTQARPYRSFVVRHWSLVTRHSSYRPAMRFRAEPARNQPSCCSFMVCLSWMDSEEPSSCVMPRVTSWPTARVSMSIERRSPSRILS